MSTNPIALALAALWDNHQHHKDHDDHDGYPGSELEGQNLAAIAALTQLTAAPERDSSRPASEQGVFRKFEVRRVDGKYPEREYFVLDVAHDPYARAALGVYARACRDTHPALSADMHVRYDLPPTSITADQITTIAAIKDMKGRPLGRNVAIDLIHAVWEYTKGGAA